MKVYIQVSVLVLCSCFVQDASSAASARKESEAAAASKYPNLKKLKTAFLDNFEAINNGNESSKLLARDIRNVVGNVLSDPLFWQLATDAMAKQAKYTSDKSKADAKIRLCNLVTDTLISPGMADGLLRLADEVYETAVHANTDVADDALRLVTDAVNSGMVNATLDSAKRVIDDVTLEPAVVHKMFNLSRKYVNTCGLTTVTDRMARTLMNGVNKFQGNAQTPQRYAPPKAAPQRSTPQKAAPQRPAPRKPAPQSGGPKKGSMVFTEHGLTYY